MSCHFFFALFYKEISPPLGNARGGLQKKPTVDGVPQGESWQRWPARRRRPRQRPKPRPRKRDGRVLMFKNAEFEICARSSHGRRRSQEPTAKSRRGAGRCAPARTLSRLEGIVLAEREGFEPSIRFLGVYTLSRSAPSTARPPLPRGPSPGRPQRSPELRAVTNLAL